MILSAFRRRVESSYSERRGIDGGFDPAISDVEVALLVQQRLIGRARAMAHGYPQAFIGQRVRLRNRHHLQVGASVSLGDYVEINALSRDGIRLGDGCTIDKYAVIRGSGGPRRLGVGVRLGERVAIGLSNVIHGGGGITIGSNCLLGPGVQIYSEHHVMSDRDVPIIEQSEFEAPVQIGDDVAIGSGSIILGPVTIGEGAIIASGSIVTSDVDPFTIVAGSPAKKIRERGLGGKRT